MARLSWAPNGLYETGLDRGVFYPKNPPLGPLITSNLVYNSAPTAYQSGGITANRWFGGDSATGSYAIVSSEAAPTGRNSFARKTWSSASETNGDTGFEVDLADSVLSVIESDVVRMGFWARNNSPTLKALTSSLFYADTGARVQLSPTRDFSPGIWTWFEFSWAIQTSGTIATTSVDITAFGDLWQAGESMDLAGVIITKNMPIDPDGWFDGNTVSSGLYSYAWSGEENNSVSYKRQIVGSAIPWNGLTSVDENGADSAVSYYVDGRPFLFFPKPKEFQATIKAYTYPDEFAAVMGLVEAADGMYLDSQVGDAFDMSYRTLIGDGVQGTDAAYKIHLIYNATVAPQSLTYESMSNSINPTDLSWDIQAVPVRIDGYRPTAHVVIDTRHMDADRIAEIEGMIYGDDTHAPAMPSPQTIFDILSFGDAIVVTDNGDGTWQAEGSYKNIYLIGDGVFQIDNINAVDNGDGSFTISDGGNTTVVTN